MNDDLISRKWLMECVEEGWVKFETEKDENKFIHLVRDTAPSAQPERKDIIGMIKKYTNCPVGECRKAFDIAIDYLRSKSRVKG